MLKYLGGSKHRETRYKVDANCLTYRLSKVEVGNIKGEGFS